MYPGADRLYRSHSSLVKLLILFGPTSPYTFSGVNMKLASVLALLLAYIQAEFEAPKPI